MAGQTWTDDRASAGDDVMMCDKELKGVIREAGAGLLLRHSSPNRCNAAFSPWRFVAIVHCEEHFNACPWKKKLNTEFEFFLHESNVLTMKGNGIGLLQTCTLVKRKYVCAYFFCRCRPDPCWFPLNSTALVALCTMSLLSIKLFPHMWHSSTPAYL
jgi:hypothetical protein